MKVKVTQAKEKNQKKEEKSDAGRSKWMSGASS